MRKAGPKPEMSSEQPFDNYFNDVVANAIDFFSISIKEIEKRPKYSVINFCAGLELILKARLLKEHWSLIMTKAESAELSRFRSGTFHSVNMETTIQRLTSICAEVFPSEEIKCYEQLRDHRNRVVHFYHDAYSKQKADANLLEHIAAEQCSAWQHLHQRLVGPWGKLFRKHESKIRKLDKQLHGLRLFLQTKCNAMSATIEQEIGQGAEYRKCSACGCKSARVQEEYDPVYVIECKVCGSRGRFLRLNCPDCGRSSDIDDITSGVCSYEDCEADIDLSHVIGVYAPSYDPKDEEEPVYYCALCEHSDKSATILGEKYFCFSCREWFDAVDRCRFCGEHLVGFDSEDSGWLGCFTCKRAAAERFAKE